MYLSTLFSLSVECHLYALNEHASRLELQMFRTVVEDESEVGMKVRISDVWIEIKVPPSRNTA